MDEEDVNWQRISIQLRVHKLRIEFVFTPGVTIIDDERYRSMIESILIGQCQSSAQGLCQRKATLVLDG